jgi:methylmalonyl-CoA/ethylmalonyl-CoA epimerase
MELKSLHHIGIVVEDLQRGIERFKGYGLSCREVTEIKEAGVKIAFFPIGDVLIELLHFTKHEKGQNTSVQSLKNAINHICFKVENLEAAIENFEKNEAKLMEGFPRAIGQGRIAFFQPETTENVLIEIMQELS